jgi:hypothetical protein
MFYVFNLKLSTLIINHVFRLFLFLWYFLFLCIKVKIVIFLFVQKNLKKGNMKLAAIIFALSIFTLIFNGCSESVEQTLYSGNINVHAPITPPPTHLATKVESGALTVSPHFYFNSNKSIDASTDNHYKAGVIPGDTNNFYVKDKNLSWSQPNSLIGVDVDLALGKSFALFGGFQYSNAVKKDLLGGNFGIGLFETYTSSAFRIDGGCTYQQYAYTAATIVYNKTIFGGGGSKSDIYYFEDDKVEMNLNPFITLTINSILTEQPLNYFFTFGYFGQNLLGFNPTSLFSPSFNTFVTDKRVDCESAFLMLNPGIYYQFDNHTRFVFGVKILEETKLSSPSQWIVLPSFQFDLQL